jgi:hypothetical protein
VEYTLSFTLLSAKSSVNLYILYTLSYRCTRYRQFKVKIPSVIASNCIPLFVSDSLPASDEDDGGGDDKLSGQ